MSDHEPAEVKRAAGTRLRSALWLPLFDELADPVVVARLAAGAEQAGWDGFFVWDHVNWHRDRRATRHGPGALRRGRRHLVADRIRARTVAGPGAWRAP